MTQKWEYLVTSVYANGDDAELQRALNGHGEDGWELVHIHEYLEDHKLTFKRPSATHS